MSVVLSGNLSATEEYARDSGEKCIACHENSEGGGKLNLEGQLYLNRILRAEAEKPPRSMFQPWLRIGIGFLHILAGVFWVGSMLFIFLVSKNPYAARGPVRNEIRYGIITILITGSTGLYLWVQAGSAPEDPVGGMFTLKIWLYLLMVLLTITFYGLVIPQLRKKAAPASDRPVGRAIAKKDLRLFDGRYNRPAYVGYKGKIYNVTPSRYWSNGEHFFRHYAGQDLTASLEDAPHGEENILRMPLAGELMDQQKIYAHWRITLAFYFVMLAILLCGISILFIIAIAQWWA